MFKAAVFFFLVCIITYYIMHNGGVDALQGFYNLANHIR